ncbi:radical SAM protein (plasmid) [Mesorhizobium sp. AR10]|uniref:radical SAM/SPASM domain-containing protein n=1 Tax=Mesorhizobium sp. AR10 TaxID=2865839 RepID=UPI00215FD3C4|nr:radical SAM protein [Mesorhizobium sp. AR10]UVK35726.1 radical SAM protein [Mesorhizobium sp. AR10]
MGGAAAADRRAWREAHWSKAGLSFYVDDQPHLFLSNGSRLYGVDEQVLRSFRALASDDETTVSRWLEASGLDADRYIDDTPIEPFPVHAISLAVAQKCNLGCTYCYAQEGDFGGRPKNMPLDVAKRSIEALIDGVEPGERVNIAFLGGEPLVNRDVLRAATEHAGAIGASKGVKVNFSVTTNGTLIRPDDADFFERHGFAVTISLDGAGATHDALRSYKSGRGSFDEIIRRVTPLLEKQHRMQVSARVTVTPRNLDLPRTLEDFIARGFFSVGFSPILSSPTGRDEMTADALQTMLDQMVVCGGAFENALIEGRRYPFLNMVNAMREIHRGTHRPYGCGAGGGYLGVSAEGAYFACHRFVDDEIGAMGTIAAGLDDDRRRGWLAERHVHRQKPCSDCGARYLCGGGCHHEVIHRGRPACDFIRGWLAYCLAAYVRLVERRPDFFGAAEATKPQ